MSGPSLAAVCDAAVLSARFDAVDLIRPETGGLREGGVCGITSLPVLLLEEGGEVLMFSSGRRLGARRDVSLEYMVEEDRASGGQATRNCKGSRGDGSTPSNGAE